jgi:hypothetical protein
MSPLPQSRKRLRSDTVPSVHDESSAHARVGSGASDTSGRSSTAKPPRPAARRAGPRLIPLPPGTFASQLAAALARCAPHATPASPTSARDAWHVQTARGGGVPSRPVRNGLRRDGVRGNLAGSLVPVSAAGAEIRPTPPTPRAKAHSDLPCRAGRRPTSPPASHDVCRCGPRSTDAARQARARVLISEWSSLRPL